MLALASSLLAGNAARAVDYMVEIGADTFSGKDATSLTCQFDRTCRGELTALGLQVAIDLRVDEWWMASLRLSGRDVGCCYFRSGREKITVDPRKPLHQEPIFKGVGERRGMIIENEYVGALFLKFHVKSPNGRDDRRLSEQPI